LLGGFINRADLSKGTDLTYEMIEQAIKSIETQAYYDTPTVNIVNPKIYAKAKAVAGKLDMDIGLILKIVEGLSMFGERCYSYPGAKEVHEEWIKLSQNQSE